MSRFGKLPLFRATDGTEWRVDVQLPGASQALIVFHHPDGATARKDRYAWLNWTGPEASNVRKNLDVNTVRAKLDSALLARLFTRSMLIGGGRPAFSPA